MKIRPRKKVSCFGVHYRSLVLITRMTYPVFLVHNPPDRALRLFNRDGVQEGVATTRVLVEVVAGVDRRVHLGDHLSGHLHAGLAITQRGRDLRDVDPGRQGNERDYHNNRDEKRDCQHDFSRLESLAQDENLACAFKVRKLHVRLRVCRVYGLVGHVDLYGIHLFKESLVRIVMGINRGTPVL